MSSIDATQAFEMDTGEKLVNIASSSTGSTFASRAGSIRHTTSKHTGRYGEGTKVEPRNASIDARMFSRDRVPDYLPPQWSAYIHPEGQLYFFKNGAIRVVTEACLNDPTAMEKVEHWTQVVQGLLPQKDIVLSDDVELFIQIEDNDCFYYFVDHRSQTSFWLDTLETDEMGIEPVASSSHLRLALQELYWIHVEYFPTHLKRLAPNALEELIGVFSHALADHMTSRNSTFPYDARDSTKFLKLLRSFREQTQDGHARCVIGRLWRLVSKHRFETHYGEQHARLSRDQAILVDTAKENRTVHILTSMLSFKTSDYYVSRLNNIYVDHLVYVHQWQPFMQKCIEDWRYLSYLSLIASLSYFLNFLPTLRFLSILSAFCFGLSFISCILLVHRHEPLADSTATDALIYLQNVRSDSFKFQWVAFVYALPKTLFFWGILGSIINCFVATSVFIAGDTAWHSCFLALSSLSLLAVMAFQDITSDKKFLGLPNFKLGWGSTEDDETLPV